MHFLVKLRYKLAYETMNIRKHMHISWKELKLILSPVSLEPVKQH